MLKTLLRVGGGPLGVLRKVKQVISAEGVEGALRSLSKLHNLGRRPFADKRLYGEWLTLQAPIQTAEAHRLLESVQQSNQTTVISLLMLARYATPDRLTQAIASVTAQSYPHWELCITDENCGDPAVKKLIEQLAMTDPRVRIVQPTGSSSNANALNSALTIASGSWIALIEPNDCICPHTLLYVVTHVARHPSARLIYTDEDKMDVRGRRCEPYFKCDWNPDLFLSQNFLGGLIAYERTLVQSVSGFRNEFEGALDYDLSLRCIERINCEQIHHIPRVLYYRRMNSARSTPIYLANQVDRDSARRALQEHHARRNSAARVECTEFGFRTHYPLPHNPPMVSLIIPTRNGYHLLKQCVDSITKLGTYPNYEIIIVDNDSDDPDILNYFQSLSKTPNITVVEDKRPFNYSALNNRAAAIAKGELIGLINNDIEVITPGWLEEMVSHAIRPNIGAVGCKLLYPDDTLQHGGVVLGIGPCAGHAHKGFPRNSPGYFGRANLVSNFSAVTAACLVVRKSVFDQVGGLNETDLAVAFNDVDFCLRLRTAGYHNIWTPYAELYHHESATRGGDSTPTQKQRLLAEQSYMKSKWKDWIDNDPAYNTNLSRENENFSYRFPPQADSTFS